jgi:hypothetical protein
VTRRGSVALLAGVLLVLAAIFAARAYRSWQVLHRPEAATATDTTQIEPWMTVRYVARVYGVSRADLAARLGVPPDGTSTLLGLARERRVPVEQVLVEARADVRELQVDQSTSTAVPGQATSETGPPRQ